MILKEKVVDRKTLRKVQLVQLEIAKEVKRICLLNDIDYFLDSGTLLGAVRHKGFIPWDDDIDIGMKRLDYEKFISIAGNEIKKDFLLQTWQSDDNYALPFAKVRKNNTVFIERGAEKSKAHNGIYIDIFPYDSYPISDIARLKQGTLLYIIKRMLLAKCKYTPWAGDSKEKRIIKTIVYFFLQIISIVYTKKSLISKYNSVAQKYNNDKNKSHLMYEQAGAARYGEWVVPESCFNDFIELKFEDTFFQCPKEYDIYLESVYSNYMELPPEEERINRHQVLEVKF